MRKPPSTELLGSILRDVSRSFYLTLRMLPSAVRPQIGLAYLLARTSDTIADTELVPAEQRLVALGKFQARVCGGSGAALEFGALAGHQQSSAERIILDRAGESAAVLESFDQWDRQQIAAVLQTIIAGQERDLRFFQGASQTSIRAFRTPADLDSYTYQVAGCVGEFWTHMCRRHLFPQAKLDDRQLLKQGVRFGKGLQLVNILRDIPADLKMGRCYVPEQDLKTQGLCPADLLDRENIAKFRPVYDRWLATAAGHLAEGWQYTNQLPYGQVRVRLACSWPLLIAFETLKLLQKGNVLDASRRLKVPRSEVKSMIFRSILCYPWPARWRRLGPAETTGRP